MVEECFEAVEAIKSENTEELKDELGDVLLQVVLHSIGEWKAITFQSEM